MSHIFNRERKKSIDNQQYRFQQYSTASVKVVNNSECPFVEGHNICLDKNYKWTIYLKQGSLDIYSLFPNCSVIGMIITVRFCNNS